MLRNALLVFALCVAGAGYVLVTTVDRHAWPMAVWGSVLVLVILLERWRYSHAHTHSGSDDSWTLTDEQFIDPETGKLTQVFYNAATGERRYVASDEDSQVN
jgi:hypothetical protein